MGAAEGSLQALKGKPMGEVAPERDCLPFAVLPLTNTKGAKHWRCGDKLKKIKNKKIPSL